MVASWSSIPCLDRLPTGGWETPALLKRMWRVDSWDWKAATAVLMVVRSERSRWRKAREALAEGEGRAA